LFVNYRDVMFEKLVSHYPMVYKKT